MKLRWIVLAGSALALAGCLALFFPRQENAAQRAAEETRRALRTQGFKTELAEFDFSASGELRTRASILTNAAFMDDPRRGPGRARSASLLRGGIQLMQPIGSDAAAVVSRQQEIELTDREDPDAWGALREALGERQEDLDAVCAAVLAGPVKFDLAAGQGNALLLPHLAYLRYLCQALATRTVFYLHNGDSKHAWTNLLASTRLVTAYQPEGVEVAYQVRFSCATIAFEVTWQALQAGAWSDEQLAQLQREWKNVEFFKDLPELAAFVRASMVATCRQQRQRPVSGPRVRFADFFRSPRGVWQSFVDYRQRVQYRYRGTYEDEKALLLHYRDRELELRRAVQSPTWQAMRALPGVTNLAPFLPKQSSQLSAILINRQLMATMQARGRRLLGSAAEAETRRRLITTALALERHRLRQGTYPNSLTELVPDPSGVPPADFMDGQPLRYRLSQAGHFVLYSVGLDCIDDGGSMPPPARPGVFMGPVPHHDLVWPRPASVPEVELDRQTHMQARQDMLERREEVAANEQWEESAKRQSGVENLLATKPRTLSREPFHRGRPIAEVLRNPQTQGTNRASLSELLSLRQVPTGREPEFVGFESLVAYDALTNLGRLHLLIDPSPGVDSDEEFDVANLDCHRATNGNCFLLWNTIYESPGKHALQIALELEDSDQEDSDDSAPPEPPTLGPFLPFEITNLCQFSRSSAYFNPAFGATLRARFPEPRAVYSVEMRSPGGELLRTISDSTSNGIATVHWDLTDEHGKRCTNEAFDSAFNIKLLDSGRSQALKGP